MRVGKAKNTTAHLWKICGNRRTHLGERDRMPCSRPASRLLQGSKVGSYGSEGSGLIRPSARTRRSHGMRGPKRQLTGVRSGEGCAHRGRFHHGERRRGSRTNDLNARGRPYCCQPVPIPDTCSLVLATTFVAANPSGRGNVADSVQPRARKGPEPPSATPVARSRNRSTCEGLSAQNQV